jgi:hypothetical protein
VISDDVEKKNSILPRPMCESMRDERVVEACLDEAALGAGGLASALLAPSSGQTWTVTLQGSLRSHIRVTEHVSLAAAVEVADDGLSYVKWAFFSFVAGLIAVTD